MIRKKGFVMLAMVATLLVAATVLFAIRALTAMTAKAEQSAQATKRMESIKQALIQFGALNGYLPCPADGSLLSPTNDPGTASPNGPTNTCANNQAAGVVPWATLGIPREASLDPWNRKITYRVFQGLTGLTRANSIRCDKSLPNASGYPACTGNTLLTVQFPTPPVNSQIAFVLVSHGESGLGARLPQGGQMTLPAPANTAERNNYANTGPFSDLIKTDPSVNANAANHFDDILLYMTQNELGSATGLGRDWP